MGLFSLKEDLTTEFREEREMLNEQIVLLKPLYQSLKKSSVQRFFGNTWLWIVEYFFYLLAVGCVIFIFIAPSTFPFSVLNTVYHATPIPAKISASDMNMLVLAGYGIVVLLFLLCILVGRQTGQIRQKNELIYEAAQEIREVLKQQIERKKMVETIQGRHQFFAKDEEAKPSVTETLNPFYEGPPLDGEEDESDGEEEEEEK